MKSMSIVLLIRFIAVAGMVVAAVPLVQADPRPFPWGWLAGLTTALITYLGTYTDDYRAWRLSGSQGHPHDIKLYNRFVNLMPPARFQDFLQRFDFGNSFAMAEVEPINQFVDGWSLVTSEFRDRKLESAKRDALATGRRLAAEIATRTRALSSGHLTVKLANTEGRPPSVLEDPRIINAAARAFSKDYERLLRLGRERLTLQ